MKAALHCSANTKPYVIEYDTSDVAVSATVRATCCIHEMNLEKEATALWGNGPISCLDNALQLWQTKNQWYSWWITVEGSKLRMSRSKGDAWNW